MRRREEMEVLMRGIFFVIQLALSPYLSQGTPIAAMEVRTSGAEVLGSTCKNGVGCQEIQNSECTNSTGVGKCMSSSVFYGEYDITTINPDSMFGYPCTDGNGCYGNTECNSTDGPGFCTCKTGFSPDDDLSCVTGAEVVGGSCRNGVGCEHIQNAECSSSTDNLGKCECSSGFHGNDGTATCDQVPASKVGDPCTAGTGCNGDTECSSNDGAGFCTCTEENHADETFSCVSGGEVVGSPCKNGVGCEHLTHSECSSANDTGTCKCSEGFHGDDSSTCTEDVKYGDDCVNGKGCESLINGKCSSSSGKGKCICNDGFFKDKNKECQKGKNVNDSCEEPNQCAFSYGNCVNGVCKCDDQHEEDTTSGLCVASLHGLCKNDIYCKSYPIEVCESTGNNLKDKACQCKEGYEEENSKCEAPNNDICDEGGCQDAHAECVPPNENTTITICICKAHYKLNKDNTCIGAGSVISVAFGALVLSLMTILTH